MSIAPIFKSDNVKVGDGSACRIKGKWCGSEKAGVAVRISEDGKEYTEIYYSPEEKKLVMDTTHSFLILRSLTY